MSYSCQLNLVVPPSKIVGLQEEAREKMPQKCPKCAPNVPQIAPKVLQLAPTMPQIALKCHNSSPKCPKCAQNSHKSAKNYPIVKNDPRENNLTYLGHHRKHILDYPPNMIDPCQNWS